MKKLLLILSTILTFSVVAEDVHIKVNGMVCSMCAQGIKKKFSNLDSVETINVDLDEKLVHIKTKKDLRVSDKQIQQIIEEAGYNVTKIERK